MGNIDNQGHTVTSTAKVSHRIADGPGLHGDTAAVIVEFDIPVPQPIDREHLLSRVAELVPQAVLAALDLPPTPLSFEVAAAALARIFLQLAGPVPLEVSARRDAPESASLIVASIDPQAAIQACEIALRLVYAALEPSTDDRDAGTVFRTALNNFQHTLAARHPDFIAAALMRVAYKRNIPVYPLVAGSAMWRYGQGSAGTTLFETASPLDSASGARLARDKYFANQLILRLGLRGVAHAIADNAAQARSIAGQLGFPLVVKPGGGGRGTGVTANITSEAELDAAFARAVPGAEGRVLVERFIEGLDYRLFVISGHLAWAARRTPPTLRGNGTSTVRELMDAENRQRRVRDTTGQFVYGLKLDDDMLGVLAKQGLTLDDIPATDRLVRLRSIANTATGGTVTDCTAEVHPDNRAMAETIARAFALDTAGIDFITPDISKSWRDIHCGVIEVNTMPGFSSDERAEIIIDRRFPDAGDGRIPTVLLVECSDELAFGIEQMLERGGCRVGVATMAQARLLDLNRGRRHGQPAEYLTALLLDPACDALVIRRDLASLESSGLPLDHLDCILLGAGLKPAAAMRAIFTQYSDFFIDDADTEALGPRVNAAITDILARRR